MSGNADENQHESDIRSGQQVIATEIAALEMLSRNLGNDFAAAIDLISACTGYVVVTGVGKSGHVGHKIAATLASTGTPSFFVHPTEASHGDLGMVQKDSVVIAISNSGETRELRDLLLFCGRQSIPVIAITSRPDSFLGNHARVLLTLPAAEEACPNKLAPTSTTAMTMALGDALAVATMERRKFSRDDFGLRHPGGSLGMQLQKIAEWMTTFKDAPNPTVGLDAGFVDVLRAISDGRCGAVCVIEENGNLAGFITDGDIRRAIVNFENPQTITAQDFLSRDPVTISKEARIGAAVEIFQTRRISQVVVVEADKPVAIIHVKDLMEAGYF